MRIQFGQSQTQKMSQKMGPRMIQSMEILQMAQAALEERIETELIENPALERNSGLPEDDEPRKKEKESKDVEEKELVVGEGTNGEDDFERLLNLDREFPDSFSDSRPSSNRIQESMDRRHDFVSNIVDRDESLQAHLLEQIHDIDLEPKLMKLCERIISSLSAKDGGYLKISLSDLLPLDASPEDMDMAEDALANVQHLDPVGIAARDLSECLLLQLSPEIKHIQNVRKLIINHLEDLQHNRIPVIQKETGMSIDEINEAWAELKKLNPRPARRFMEDFVPTVTPDMWLEIDDEGKFTVRMEEGQSKSLRISNYFRQRLQTGQATKEEKEFIKRKLASAQWLIDSIEQRRNTLVNVAQKIVDYQRDYFIKGPEHLKPLKMEQIAQEVKVNVTTISRAVGDKWIETPRGILPLRMFFVHGTTTDDGEEVAWNKIKLELQKLIDSENKAKPYSDDELRRRLGEMGFPVARRTIAKYREKLSIPSSRQRKDWSKKKS